MVFSLILYIIGLLGFILNRRNIILAILSIELMLLSITILILIYSNFYNDIYGIVVSLYSISLAGCESAISLAIVVNYNKSHGTIYLN